MKACPICGQLVEVYHEVTFTEPFTHNMPYDGLVIYGTYYSPKETICYQDNFLHFAFNDAAGNLIDHRLVQLGVENPSTKAPSQEYFEDWDDDDDIIPEEWDDEYSPWDDDSELEYEQIS